MRTSFRVFLATLLGVALFGAVAAEAESSMATTPRFALDVPVLYYHHVLCPSPDTTFPDLYICPDQFAAQMTYMHDQGWQTVTVDDLTDLIAAHQCPDPKTFVVSFDDGAVDQYDNAAPILEGLGMRGTFFVTTGKEDGLRPGKITWDGLRDLVARGHAIGDHSKTHENEKKLDAAGLYDQIEVAQQIFEDQLGFGPAPSPIPMVVTPTRLSRRSMPAASSSRSQFTLVRARQAICPSSASASRSHPPTVPQICWRMFSLSSMAAGRQLPTLVTR